MLKYSDSSLTLTSDNSIFFKNQHFYYKKLDIYMLQNFGNWTLFLKKSGK